MSNQKRKVAHYRDVEEFLRFKTSVNVIYNDHLREARALVLGLANVAGMKGAAYQRLRDRCGYQRRQAQQLMQHIDVTDNPITEEIFTRLCGNTEFADIKVCLFDRIGFEPYRELGDIFSNKVVNIFVSDPLKRCNVYLLKNMGSLMGKPVVCELCGKHITRRGKAHRCARPTIRRRAEASTEQADNQPHRLVKCLHCCQTVTVARKVLHRQQCKSMYCDQCRQFRRKNAARLTQEHVCGEYNCKNCAAIAPPNHVCYLKVVDKPRIPNRWRTDTKPPYLFFDIETEAAGVHVPVLACVQYTNGKKHTFFGYNCIVDLVDFFCQKEHHGYTIFAFNLAYDGWFTMREHIKRQHDIDPLFRGLKLLSIDVKHHKLKYMDLFAFLTMRLDALPKALGLDDTKFKKGVFPYRMINAANMDYRGVIPALDMFDLDKLSATDRQQFEAEHAVHAANTRYEWDFRKELVSYCQQDVTILRQATLAFRKLFFEISDGLDCFEVVTLASAAHAVFRARSMPAETLAVFPYGGYRKFERQSLAAKEWLMWTACRKSIYIQSALNTQEARVGRFKVDGYDAVNRTVYEFYGKIRLVDMPHLSSCVSLNLNHHHRRLLPWMP